MCYEVTVRTVQHSAERANDNTGESPLSPPVMKCDRLTMRARAFGEFRGKGYERFRNYGLSGLGEVVEVLAMHLLLCRPAAL